MQDQFVTYEIALELKYLGFDKPCLAMYSDKELNMWAQDQYDWRDENINDGFQFKNSMWNDSRFIAAPLIQQAIQFFEDKFGILIQPVWFKEEGWHYTSVDLLGQYNSCYVGEDVFETECFDTKQKALESAILMMIEITKTKKSAN